MKPPRLTLAVGVALTIASGIKKAHSASLPLASFLDQVRSQHQGYRAAIDASRGAELQSTEAALLLHPQLSFEGQILSDARPQLNRFVPQKTDSTGFKLGVTQQLPLGIQTQFSYQFSHIQLDIPPSTASFFNVGSYYDAIPSLELTIPLARGRGGSEFQATQIALQSSKLIVHFQEVFRAQTILLEAEWSYWRLALAREAVKIQRRVLQRSQFLENWAKDRLKLKLGDTSDLLQAKASRSSRELELKNALDEERLATQNFNTFRGREALEAVPALSPLGAASTEPLAPLDLHRTARADLQAAEQLQMQGFAHATQSFESNRPKIDFFASLSLNGRAESASEAIKRGWDFDQKTSVIGVRVVSTLDFWNRSKASSGALQERDSTTLGYDRKRFEYEQEWMELNSRLKEAQTRLKLTQELATLHSAKLERDRDKLKRGRSTTFQVIQFENDAALAELNALRARLEVIRVRAHLATFATPAPPS